MADFKQTLLVWGRNTDRNLFVLFFEGSLLAGNKTSREQNLESQTRK